MQKKTFTFPALAFLVLAVLPGGTCQAQAEKASYPAASYPNMAPLDQYLMPDVSSEIALARSAAPASISDGAEVMVLGAKGYTTAIKGTNGFLCIVERSWGAATDEAEFWNPKVRAPICFNPQAAKTFAPIFLMKTRLVLAGKSKPEIVEATASALDKNELPALEPGADVLHALPAAVLERPRHELASTCDVFCSRRRSKNLGSRSPRLAGSGGRRS